MSPSQETLDTASRRRTMHANPFYTGPPTGHQAVIQSVILLFNDESKVAHHSIAKTKAGEPCMHDQMTKEGKPVAASWGIVGALSLATGSNSQLRYDILWHMREFLGRSPIEWWDEKDRSYREIMRFLHYYLSSLG